MIRLIFLFIVLGAGVFAGTQFAGQQGYVLISLANTTVEMSVTTLVLIVIALLAALFSLEYLVKKVIRASSSTWGWFHLRKLKHSRRYTNDGLIKLLEGDWKVAEKKLSRWANHHDKPLICYLLAAEASHKQNNKKQRDHYLSLAARQDEAQLVVGLYKTKFQTADGDIEGALDGVSQLHAQYPNNPVILDRLKTLYIETKAWASLLKLLPMLLKNHRIENSEFEHLTLQAQSALLIDMAQKDGLEGLRGYWSKLSKKTQQEPELIYTFVDQLIALKADDEAYAIVKKLIKRHPDSQWLLLLSKMNCTGRQAVISQLKSLVRDHDDNADLHSVLGQLYLREQQYEAAQSHFERALAIRSTLHDYAYLTNALEQQKLTTAAMETAHKMCELVGEAAVK